MSLSQIPRKASTGLLSSSTSRTVIQRTQSKCFICAYPGVEMVGSSESTKVSRSSYHARFFHQTAVRKLPPAAPKSKDRGPKSEEDTQTDFTAMNILSNTPVPTTAVDACMDDGFALDSGLKVSGSGVLLMGGEAFKWRPWVWKKENQSTIGGGAARDDEKAMTSLVGETLNAKGQWEVSKEAWGILNLVWPKPDLLILGTGSKMIPISPKTRRDINDLGIRVEIQDTRNAAAQFNLLATERGVQQVAAALVPIGWRGIR